MDVFSRTFLPAMAESGLPMRLVSRHMPVLRRCAGPDESTILVTTCHRPGHPVAGTCLLLLTDRSLVVSRESRAWHRVRPHLLADVSSLRDVTWTTDPRRRSMELAVTTPDRIRERFRIPVRDARRFRRLDAAFRRAFRLRPTGGGGRRPPTRLAGILAQV